MDASLSLAPAAPLPASAPQALSPASPPWEVEVAEAPVRSAREPVLAISAPIRAEKVPLGIFVLTVVTAVLLVFGARSANPEGARIMDFAAAQPHP